MTEDGPGIIPDKATYYRLSNAMKLGNTLPVWGSIEEIIADEYDGLVAIRMQGPNGGREFIPNLTITQASARAKAMIERGTDPAHILYQMMDGGGGRRTLTGFVMRTERGYHLEYSFRDELVRDAMAKDHHAGNHATGLRAKLMMQAHMEPNDWEDLMDLFDAYPDAIIEFSVFERDLGWAKRRRTIYWEVRHY